MVNNTTNIGLLKPTEDELYSINVSNQNMDIIDISIKGLQDEINTPSKSTITLDKSSKILSCYDSYASPSDLKIGGASLFNAVTNGDFSGGITGWSAIGGSIAVVNGKLEFTENTSNSEHYIQCSVSGIKASTKHFIEATCLNGGVAVLYNLNSVGGYDVYEGTTIVGSGISKLVFTTGTINVSPTSFIRLYPKFMVYTGTSAKYSFDDLMLIPMTGIPYEAYTADQMNGLVNKYVDKLQGAEAVVVGSRGRNKFDKSKIKKGYWLGGMTAPLNPENPNYWHQLILCKPNTTYTLKMTASVGTFRMGLNYYDGFSPSIGIYDDVPRTTNTITVTTSSIAKYLIVSQLDLDISAFPNIQLNEGTTALPYEPYQGSQAVISATRHKLPNLVEDELKFVDGKWVFVKRTGEYMLTSADIQSLYTAGVNNDVVEISKKTNYLYYGVATDLDGSMLPYKITPYADTTAKIGQIYAGTLTFGLMVAKGTYANLAAAQAALSGTKVVYQLATPIIIEEQNFAQYDITVDGSLSSNLDYTEYFIADHDIMADVSIDYATNLAKAVEQLKDSVDGLHDRIDTLGTGDWIAPTLLNGWVNMGGQEPTKYFKDEFDFVHIRAMITSGSAANGTVLFILPVGFRPPNDVRITTSSNNLYGLILVKATTGEVSIQVGTNTWLAIYGEFKV